MNRIPEANHVRHCIKRPDKGYAPQEGIQKPHNPDIINKLNPLQFRPQNPNPSVKIAASHHKKPQFRPRQNPKTRDTTGASHAEILTPRTALAPIIPPGSARERGTDGIGGSGSNYLAALPLLLRRGAPHRRVRRRPAGRAPLLQPAGPAQETRRP